MKTTNGSLTANLSCLPAAKATAASKIPMWLKVAFSAFMAVLVPVYWQQYGPTNFLYFCDAALFLTLAAIWMESSLLASMAAVGILVPQLVWCADFAANLAGFNLIGMTAYMFDPKLSLFLRGLSFFHGWLPFLLIFIVLKLGYDKRALPAWTLLAWALILIAFFFLPEAGAVLPNPKTPVNVNYVYGLSDSAPQTYMSKYAWLALMMTALPVVFYAPVHWILKRVAR